MPRIRYKAPHAAPKTARNIPIINTFFRICSSPEKLF